MGYLHVSRLFTDLIIAGSTILSGKCKASPPNYDYDAPVSEAGDPTDKYLPLRQVVGKVLSAFYMFLILLFIVYFFIF